MPIMLAMELTLPPAFCSLSGASTTDAAYRFGMLNPTISPSTAPTAQQMRRKLRACHRRVNIPIRSISVPAEPFRGALLFCNSVMSGRFI